MNDLISRQALRDAMYHEAFETDSDMQRWDSGCWIRYKMFENAIEAAPTIDPVKHGRWEHRMLTSYPAKAICVCNLCGQVMDREYFYCPHCGAKMENNPDYTKWLEEKIEPMIDEWVCDLFAWVGSDYCEENCNLKCPTIECLRAAFEAERGEDGGEE